MYNDEIDQECFTIENNIMTNKFKSIKNLLIMQ